MKQLFLRGLLWLCVLTNSAMIFFFSSQNGEASSVTSGQIVVEIIETIDPDYDQRQPGEQLNIYGFVEKLVRKGAHFLEYAALGFFLRLLIHSHGWHPPTRICWTAGTLYACTDELHQLFIAQRAAMWQDVLLDSTGVLAGIVVAYTLLELSRRWRHWKQTKS